MLTAYFENNLGESMLLPHDTQNLFDQEGQSKISSGQHSDLPLENPLSTQFKLSEELHSHHQSPQVGPYNHASSHVSPAVSNQSDIETPLHVSEKSPVSHSSPHLETLSSKPSSSADSGGESPIDAPNSLILANNDTLKEETYIKDAKSAIVELRKFIREAPGKINLDDKRAVFELPNSEKISCVHWDNAYYMTGTDIVRSLVHRFAIFGRDVQNRKKFEEGVFSDLRNLKIGQKSQLEDSKSSLLEHLYKLQCVRTKKKQKVFFWNQVNHEELFLYALSRELKKENPQESGGSDIGTYSSDSQYQRQKFNENNGKSASTASTVAKREPALSFEYDPTHALIDQVASILNNMKPSHAEIFRELTTADPLRSMYSDTFGQQFRDRPSLNSRASDNYGFNMSASPSMRYASPPSIDFTPHLRLSSSMNASRSPYQHPNLAQPRRHSLVNGVYNSMERYPITPQVPQVQMLPNSLQNDFVHWDNNMVMPQRHGSSPPSRMPIRENHYTIDNISNNSTQFHSQPPECFDAAPYSAQDGFISIDGDGYVRPEQDRARNGLSRFNPDLAGPGPMLQADSSSIDSQSCLNGSLDTLVTNAGNHNTEVLVDDFETDFSLEVLVREDQDQRMLPTRPEKSFDAQYSEFVHQNRPALRGAQFHNSNFVNERPNDFTQCESDGLYMPSQDSMPQEWGQFLNTDDLKQEQSPIMNPYENSFVYRGQPLDVRTTFHEDTPRHYGTSGNSNGVSKRTNRKPPSIAWNRGALVEDFDPSSAQWSNCVYDRY